MDHVTLTGLKERFDEEIARTGKVTLDQRALGARKNLDFVATLRGEQLVLTSVKAILDETVSPGKLTVTGNPETIWMIRGLNGTGLTAVSVALIYEAGVSGASDSPLVFEGMLTIGGQPMPCVGSLAEKGILEFGLKAAKAVRLPLQAAAEFVAGAHMTDDYLPTGIELFTTIPITAVELSFGLSYKAPTQLRLSSEVGGPWNFIEGLSLDPLKNVGLRLFSTYHLSPSLHASTTYGADIHADFVLAGHEMEVRLALNPTDVWELALVPKSGGTMPGLLDLAQALGVKASVETALNALNLGDICVLGVSIGYSLKGRKLLYFSIAGRVQVAHKNFDLWLRLPDFQFGGGLTRGESISFREIAEHFFDAGDNQSLPDVKVEEFSLAAQPGAGTYSLAVDLQEKGFTLGPVTLAGLNFFIEKTPQGFDGEMTATLMIAGATIRVSAKHPSPDAGWEFSGSTGPGQQIPIGTLIADLAKLFGEDITKKLPPAIAHLTIEDLQVSFNTKTKNFTFTCKAQFPVDDNAKVAITVTIALTNEKGSHEKKFGGKIEINVAKDKAPLGFQLEFIEQEAQGKTSDLFIATYPEDSQKLNRASQKLNIGDLVRAIVQDKPDWTHALDGIDIDLKDALFVFSKTGEEKKFLFGLDIGAEISLADLPLVGKEFSSRKVGIDDLQVLITSKPFNAAEVQKLNGLLPGTVTKLPDISQAAKAQDKNQDTKTDNTKIIALKQGLNIGATLKLGDAPRSLSLPVVASGTPQTSDKTDSTPPPTTQPTTTQPTTTADNAVWFKIQKAIGPMHFERIGMQYKDKRVWFLLDAALSAAGLTISLDGLSIGSPINLFDPCFKLRGLGIDYRNEALEIGGAFLEIADHEYAGAAVIKAKQLTLSALGMYKEIADEPPKEKADKRPSLFVYAVLDYPLGGPSFFYVTGLAAGFGYNRALKIPGIDQVASFSLVENARKGAGMPKDITTELRKLADDIKPAAGENFLAIGIKFNSFKTVDSFALLTLAFGSHFELHMLGLSTLIAPANRGPGVSPVAEAQLALKASFLPDKGILSVQAQLTPNSYLLSQACHLTGGFAFYTWFAGSEHKGDFVLTLGGYHPNFRVPTHYPTVPRLGFNWQVNNEFSLKGDAYFALTASALMAGGHLEANYRSGHVHAWFKVGADFLIAWQPYHYEISAYVDMGAEVTFEFFGTQHITVDVGADLHIWGPEFSGEATIHLWIISFTVAFGAGAAHKPSPILWPEFKRSFLPADNEVCTIAVADGLISRNTQGATDLTRKDAVDLGVINPKDFSLAINTVFPLTEAWYVCKTFCGKIELGARPLEQWGIAPMGIKAADLSSRQIITIKHNGDPIDENPFAYTPVLKKVPAGLWGESLTPELNGSQFVEKALAGFELRPNASPQQKGVAIARSKLQDDAVSGTGQYRWEQAEPFCAAAFDSEQKRKDELQKNLAQDAANRKALLKALGFGPEDLGRINLRSLRADDFLIAPQIEDDGRP